MRASRNRQFCQLYFLREEHGGDRYARRRQLLEQQRLELEARKLKKASQSEVLHKSTGNHKEQSA